MGRSDEFRPSNPAERYYDWRSDQSAFCWYDKDNDERIVEPIPFKFLIIRQSIRITGVDDQTKQQVLSNEVKAVSKEVLKVRLKDGTPIADGLWKDIKEEVKVFGGHYTKIIFAMDEHGSLICLRVRTKGLLSWGETIDKSQKKQKDEWIVVDGFHEDQHTDGNKYTYPTFSFGGKLLPEQYQKADELYDELKEYYEQLSGSAAPVQVAAPVAKQSTVKMPEPSVTIPFAAEDGDDDLPF